jgi:hypothetical protein
MVAGPALLRPDSVIIGTWSPEALGIEIGALFLTEASAAHPNANRAFFIPFRIARPLTVAKLWSFNGATVSGNIDVGIYDAAGARLVSSGSTAQAGTTAIQEFDVADTALDAPAQYYLGVALNNATGTLRRYTPAVPLGAAIGCAQQDTAFPLPSPATFAVHATAYVPIVGLSARALVN